MNEPYLSGESGLIAGPRLRTRAAIEEAVCDAGLLAMRAASRLDALARATPVQRVLVLSAYRAGSGLPESIAELRRSAHDLSFALGAMGEAAPALAAATAATGLTGGKYPNVSAAISASGHDPASFDWLLVVDDDVVLPRRFLDRFLALAEHFDLQLAQPAQTRRSHAAWSVTRRRPLSLLRRTEFVEIGPVTVISAAAVAELLPFPDLRFGWGLDARWAATAAQRGWRLGIADATPVRHEGRGVASDYGHDEAIAEARAFLDGAEVLPRERALATLSTHRRLR